MRLIDKDALVAEIERMKDEYLKYCKNIFHAEWSCGTLDNILCFIDTLEVKEVDLEEDITDFINEEYHYTEYEGKWVDEKDWRDSIQRCAKHFFELGLKAQKGE